MLMNEWGYNIGRDLNATRTYFTQHPTELNVADDHGHTPVGYAVQVGDRETVTLLLHMGAELTPEAAILLGLERTVADMLAADPTLVRSIRIAARKYPLLWFAAAFGQVGIAELLLRYGVDVNIPDLFNSTPLHGAAQHGQIATARWLIEHGARADTANRWGITPLYHAAAGGHQAVAALLAEHGAAVNARTVDGGSPLAVALLQGHAQLAEWLVGLGAQP